MTSTKLEYHLFTRPEMDRRYARAREMMGQRGIDALLVTGEENFQYFAGTTASIGLHYSACRPSIFVLPMDRDPIILTQTRDNLTLGSYVEDIRDYFDLLNFPHNEVLEALKDAGLKNQRVGAELGLAQRMGMPVGAYLALVEALPQVAFVDAADVFVGLRMAKSQEEVAYMKKAAEITSRARQRLYDSELVPGMTEREVVRALRRLILEEGGDRTSFVHVQWDTQSKFPGAKNPFPLRPAVEEGHRHRAGLRGILPAIHHRFPSVRRSGQGYRLAEKGPRRGQESEQEDGGGAETWGHGVIHPSGGGQGHRRRAGG